MKNSISSEIRKNLTEAAKKPATKKKEINNPFDSDELVKLIVDYLKKNGDVGNIETNYEPYSVISGDYIYFTVDVDGDPIDWVIAVGGYED